MKNLIIFTDLDGTLLDASTYSDESAQEALGLIHENKIPSVIVSSKTAKEIMHYRERLKNRHPFVSENGGGIFIPKEYFREMPFWINISERFGFDMIVQGTPYEELLRGVDALKAKGFRIKGFSDLTVAEIQEITGLNENEAGMSKERDFDEPIIVDETVDVNALKKAIRSIGLRYTAGRFLHLIGNNDKGRAVRVVRDLYKKNIGDVITIAIGDNLNDIPMFLNVDYPIVVKKPDGTHDGSILKEVPNIRLSDDIGPKGFNASIIHIIGELRDKA